MRMSFLIRSIPMALSRTENVCSSVNVGSTRCGINMDAVRLLGEIIKETAEYTKGQDSFRLCKAGGILQCAGR